MDKPSLVNLIYDAHLRLAAMEAKPRDYGGGRPLFASEVHALTRIQETPGINLTELASRLEVSKSAASKVTRKLLGSGFIETRRLDDNRKETHFFVTERGTAAAKGHRVFRERVFGPLFEREARLDVAERVVVSNFLIDLYRLLEEA